MNSMEKASVTDEVAAGLRVKLAEAERQIGVWRAEAHRIRKALATYEGLTLRGLRDRLGREGAEEEAELSAEAEAAEVATIKRSAEERQGGPGPGEELAEARRARKAARS